MSRRSSRPSWFSLDELKMEELKLLCRNRDIDATGMKKDKLEKTLKRALRSNKYKQVDSPEDLTLKDLKAELRLRRVPKNYMNGVRKQGLIEWLDRFAEDSDFFPDPDEVKKARVKQTSSKKRRPRSPSSGESSREDAPRRRSRRQVVLRKKKNSRRDYDSEESDYDSEEEDDRPATPIRRKRRKPASPSPNLSPSPYETDEEDEESDESSGSPYQTESDSDDDRDFPRRRRIQPRRNARNKRAGRQKQSRSARSARSRSKKKGTSQKRRKQPQRAVRDERSRPPPKPTRPNVVELAKANHKDFTALAKDFNKLLEKRDENEESFDEDEKDFARYLQPRMDDLFGRAFDLGLELRRLDEKKEAVMAYVVVSKDKFNKWKTNRKIEWVLGVFEDKNLAYKQEERHKKEYGDDTDVWDLAFNDAVPILEALQDQETTSEESGYSSEDVPVQQSPPSRKRRTSARRRETEKTQRPQRKTRRRAKPSRTNIKERVIPLSSEEDEPPVPSRPPHPVPTIPSPKREGTPEVDDLREKSPVLFDGISSSPSRVFVSNDVADMKDMEEPQEAERTLSPELKEDEPSENEEKDVVMEEPTSEPVVESKKARLDLDGDTVMQEEASTTDVASGMNQDDLHIPPPPSLDDLDLPGETQDATPHYAEPPAVRAPPVLAGLTDDQMPTEADATEIVAQIEEEFRVEFGPSPPEEETQSLGEETAPPDEIQRQPADMELAIPDVLCPEPPQSPSHEDSKQLEDEASVASGEDLPANHADESEHAFQSLPKPAPQTAILMAGSEDEEDVTEDDEGDQSPLPLASAGTSVLGKRSRDSELGAEECGDEPPAKKRRTELNDGESNAKEPATIEEAKTEEEPEDVDMEDVQKPVPEIVTPCPEEVVESDKESATKDAADTSQQEEDDDDDENEENDDDVVMTEADTLDGAQLSASLAY